MDFPSLDGELRRDEEALAGAARDFGCYATKRPVAVVLPASYDDVAKALRFAAKSRLHVVTRGQAHSTGGQAQVEGGLVLDLRHLSAIHEPTAVSIRCQAGAIWLDVLERALSRGRTPPVLTDYLKLSVGGTLSVGGMGGQSHRAGAQVDRVLSLTVATGRGTIVQASREREQDYFNACRAGLGRGGVILEAEIELVEAPERVGVHRLTYADLGTFLGDQTRLALEQRFDYLYGNIAEATQRGAAWCYSIKAVEYLSAGASPGASITDLRCDAAGATYEEQPYLAYCARLNGMEAAMRASGSWALAHPWMDVFVPATQAEALIGKALASFTSADLGEGNILTYPMCRRASTAPLFRLPDEPTSFLFDVLPSVPRDALSAWLRRSTDLVREALAVGGTIYPIGSAQLTAHDWRAHFGTLAPEIERLRDSLDPDGILGADRGR